MPAAAAAADPRRWASRWTSRGWSAQLVDLGYARVDQVEDAGDFSVRGGLIDVFPGHRALPGADGVLGRRGREPAQLLGLLAALSGTAGEVRLLRGRRGAGSRAGDLLVAAAGRARCVVRSTRPGRARGWRPSRADLVDVLGDACDGRAERYARLAAGGGAASGGACRVDRRCELRSGMRRRRRGGRRGCRRGPRHQRRAAGDQPAGGRGGQSAAGGRRLPGGHRLRAAGRGRAGRLRAAPGHRDARARPARSRPGPGVSFLPVPHRRHFIIPDLKLALLTDAQVFPRRHKAAPARRPLAGAGALQLPRPAQGRLRGARGPRRGPLRGHLHQDGGRGHPRLPRPRLPRQGHALRAPRPDRQGHALRGGGRDGAGSLQAGRQGLGARQEPGAQGGPPGGRRAAASLRAAPGHQGLSASPRTASGRCASRRPSPTRRPRTSCGPSTRSRTTWSPTSPWTGCSAATWATARPRWRCGPPSRPRWTASR